MDGFKKEWLPRRPWLWLGGGVYVLGATISLLVWPLRGWPQGITSIDFIDPLTAARILRSGSTCIYCAAAQHAALVSYLHVNVPAGNQSSFLDPPLAGFVMQPLAGLEVHVALAILLLVSLACLFTACWLLFRFVLPVTLGRAQRVIVSGASVLVLPSASSVWVGQWDPFLLLVAVAGTLLLKSGKTFSAGLVLSILLLKPQLIWLLPVVLTSARQWRVLAGMATGALFWAISAALILGVSHIWDWPAAAGYSYAEGLGIPHIVVLITSSKLAASASLPILVLIVFAVVERRCKSMRGAPELAVGIGLAASIACSPHVYDYDLLMLALPLCLWARTQPLPALGAAVGLRLVFALSDVVHWSTPLYIYVVWLIPVAILAGLVWRSSEVSPARQSA